MKKVRTVTMIMVLFLLGTALFAGTAVAQEKAKTVAEQFVGTWTLVELFYTTHDGTRVNSFGSDPRGRLRLEADGSFTLQIMRSGLPKFKSNNREQGTDDENRAVVQGTVSYYGTYSVNEKDKIFAVHIEACSYPNFDGVDQQRPFTLKGDILTFTNKNSSVAGSSVQQTWRKIK